MACRHLVSLAPRGRSWHCDAMEIMALLSDPAAWLALLTLIALEVVLGIDNLIFIAILSNKLPEHQQQTQPRILRRRLPRAPGGAESGQGPVDRRLELRRRRPRGNFPTSESDMSSRTSQCSISVTSNVVLADFWTTVPLESGSPSLDETSTNVASDSATSDVRV